MVWYIDNYQTTHSITKVHFGFEITSDRIFQTGSIVFDLCEKSYEILDISSLIATGVNVFNVDRTVYDENFLKGVEEIITEIENKILVFPELYYRPITLSVTMTVDNPVDISKRVDFIILKGVTESLEITEFRTLRTEYESIPILIYLGVLEMEANEELIKISNGVILDVGNGIFNKRYDDCMKKCHEHFKPVMYTDLDLIEDYYSQSCNDRKLMILANKLVETKFHGIVLKDSIELNFAPTELVHSFVKAMHIAELQFDADMEFYKKSFDVKIPALIPVSVAYGASLAALQSDASAIFVLTASGQSAKTIAFASPTCHVIAITTRVDTARKLNYYRKVVPLVYNRKRAHSWLAEWRNRVGFGTAFALSARLFSAGAKLVVLAPSEEGIGYCDGFQIVSVPFKCDE